MTKPKEKMTERDWRIFRENNDIIIKGSRVPHPIRNWDEIEGINQVLRDNISFAGYAKPMAI
jgi:ATP-dependent RNA helicase DDX23/PRP28